MARRGPELSVTGADVRCRVLSLTPGGMLAAHLAGCGAPGRVAWPVAVPCRQDVRGDSLIRSS